jgi:hypothetical protein
MIVIPMKLSGRVIAGSLLFRGYWPGMWQKVERNLTSPSGIVIAQKKRHKILK